MYTKILDQTIWVCERLLMALFGSSIIIVTLQIFFRYFLGSPLNWSEQVARCIFIWIVMLSVPLIIRKDGAIAFDLLVEFVPVKAREILNILVQLLILFFAAYYFLFSFQLCIETSGRIMAGVAIPQNSVYIAAPIAMFILIFVACEKIANSFAALKGGKK